MGGAAIADEPERGVVDHTGQVFGNPGLYIADGALFPRASGIPPAMTIAALAERQASLLNQPTPAPPTRPGKRFSAKASPGKDRLERED